MKLTEEEYQFCEKHIDLIKKIVRTASSSYIDPEYRDGLITIGKKYKIMDCTVCNSSLYLGTCRLFYIYEADKLEKTELEAKNKPVETTKTEDNTNTKEEPKKRTRTTKSKK